MCQMIHNAFHAQNPLRPTKPAKGGCALRICFQAVALNADIGQEIGVIRVQHRTIRNGQR